MTPQSGDNNHGIKTATLTATLLLIAAQPAAAQPGWVLSHLKIFLENEPILGQTAHCLIEAERNPVGFATFHFNSGTQERSRS